MRDDFSVKVKDALARRVGFKCSNPDCRKSTSGPSQEDQTKHINLGVAAHICAASEGGPRYNGKMSSIERASFDNGIWLCQSCAKIIDSDTQRFTTELLAAWKDAAERIAFAELQSSTSSTIFDDDKSIIKFFATCFDRPAFQHEIVQEGHMEHLIEQLKIPLSRLILVFSERETATSSISMKVNPRL